MKDMQLNNDKVPVYNKKAVMIIIVLFILGIITGILLSSFFINEANQKINKFEYGGKVIIDPDFKSGRLMLSDIFIPSIGVIIVCISMFLLFGLIVIYIKIFLTTNSKYIVGLLFIFIPLSIKAIFSVNTLRSLFVSPAIPYFHIKESIGFGFGGLGGILIMVSIFEIIGLSILLYLSSE
jgi:hypothetical protein